MSKLRDAAQQALEALIAATPVKAKDPQMQADAIVALRAALAEQPAKREPVAWKHDCAALLTNGVELWIDACPHCGKPRPAPQPAAVPAEDAIEAAYWDFDARHKGYGPHKTMPQSERDAFKWAVRAMLAAAIRALKLEGT